VHLVASHDLSGKTLGNRFRNARIFLVNNRSALRRYAWLSILAAVLTIGIKAAGYWLTRSVGLLSDALESGVNLIAAISALAALTISAQPPDEDHAYGHQKVEYLSSGAEGGLIGLAAISIIITAVQRLLDPQPLSQLSLGLALSWEGASTRSRLKQMANT